MRTVAIFLAGILAGGVIFAAGYQVASQRQTVASPPVVAPAPRPAAYVPPPAPYVPPVSNAGSSPLFQPRQYEPPAKNFLDNWQERQRQAELEQTVRDQQRLKQQLQEQQRQLDELERERQRRQFQERWGTGGTSTSPLFR